jgi:putative copper resistance protein D
MTTTAPAASRSSQSVSGVRPVRVLVGAGGIALVALVVALWTGDGRPAPALPGLPDAGPLTSWGLPAVRTLADLAAILTVGLLLAGAVLVPARDGVLVGARLRWTRIARWSALAWALLSLAELVLSLSDVLASPAGSVLDPTLLWSFARDIGVGRSLVVQVVLALVVAGCAAFIRTTTGALLTLVVALGTVVIPTFTSHSGTSADHSAAVTTLLVHVLALSLWCGGIAALVLLGSSDRRPLPVALPRFSRMALWCAIAVALSGIASAALRLGSPGDLISTSYGRLVLVKTALMAVIAGFGLWHRRHVLHRLTDDVARRLFLRVAGVEVLVMAATVGVAVALSRTPPPSADNLTLESLTPARSLLGFDLPPPPDVANLLWGQMRLDGVWIGLVLLLGALYAAGVVSLRRRGEHWPWGRSALWTVGLLVIALMTVTGVATYSHVMFSVHMTQHMVLTMLAPVFLVLGAPFSLALAALPQRPGQVGPREWIERFLGSRALRAVANPLVASLLFLFSYYGVYFTGLFSSLMLSHAGHVAMNLGFVLVGYVFFWTLIGVDPGPRKPPFIAGLVIMIAVMALHSFFAIAMTMTQTVVAEEFYSALQRPYAQDLLADQHLGANIGWASGDIPMLLVMAAMFVQWVRADERDARSSDAAQDHAAATGEGSDELAEYNAYLASLADRDRRAGR